MSRRPKARYLAALAVVGAICAAGVLAESAPQAPRVGAATAQMDATCRTAAPGGWWTCRADTGWPGYKPATWRMRVMRDGSVLVKAVAR